MNKNIVKGYKGIIDLDLSLVPIDHRESAIKQHYQDIKDYKKYQKTLKPEHRYENTILRIKKQIENEDYLRNLRKQLEQTRRYELANKIYNLNK